MNNKKDKIKDILSRVLELNEVPDDISQNSCGKWDSIHHLQLVVELEMAFDASIEPEEIAVMKSLEDIVRVINTKL